jgi:hypothetical protein
MLPERARERAPLLRLHHQKISVAELVALVPERHVLADRGAQVKHWHDRHARDRERQHGRRMMMNHRHHVGPRLIDAAMNDTLGKELLGRRLHRLRIERELEHVGGLHQLRRARARQQIAIGITRMAQADMAEGVQHALVG